MQSAAKLGSDDCTIEHVVVMSHSYKYGTNSSYEYDIWNTFKTHKTGTIMFLYPLSKNQLIAGLRANKDMNMI